MQHKKFLLATFPVHVTFIGIEVTKFLLLLFFTYVAEEFSFYILHCHISSLIKRCYNLGSKLVTFCVKTFLHFALKVFTLRVHVIMLHFSSGLGCSKAG